MVHVILHLAFNSLFEQLTCAQRRTWAFELWSWKLRELPTPSAGCLSSSEPPFYQIQILKIDSKHIWQNMCLGSPSVPSASSRRGRGVPQVRCSPTLSWHAPSPPGCQGAWSPNQDNEEKGWWCGWQGVMCPDDNDEGRWRVTLVGDPRHLMMMKEVYPVAD